MLPSKHFTFGILFALVLLFIFPQMGFLGFFIILISTVVIDMDHYFYYVYQKKNFNLIKAYRWVVKNGIKFQKMNNSQRKKIYFCPCFLHGIEIMIVLSLLFIYFKFPFFLFVLTGFIFHQFLDLLELVHEDINPCKVLSLTYSLFYAKNKTFLEDYKLE